MAVVASVFVFCRGVGVGLVFPISWIPRHESTKVRSDTSRAWRLVRSPWSDARSVCAERQEPMPTFYLHSHKLEMLQQRVQRHLSASCDVPPLAAGHLEYHYRGVDLA